MDTPNSEKLFRYLQNLHIKYQNISELLSSSEIANNPKKLGELSRELSQLKKFEDTYLKYEKFKKQESEANEILESSEDSEMSQLAREELEIVSEEMGSLEDDIKRLMITDETADNRNVFLEIRSGAGGNEASLFAQDLLRMYTRVAERKSWKSEVISTNYSAIGGIKEIILYIKGSSVNQYLKFESGVHRVQRVPVTESSGRIHTSTVTVAVIPEVDDVEVDINPKDLRIDTFSSSAPGGQHVNRTQSAIRITHFPTGIVVSCQDEKSQHKNKDKAMKVLKSRLFELEMSKQHEDIASNRKSQVGAGDRSEKIRTYNFPQNRVTDHRVTGNNFNIETILDGSTDQMIQLLTEWFTKQEIERKLKEISA